jgi:hypothetical protein
LNSERELIVALPQKRALSAFHFMDAIVVVSLVATHAAAFIGGIFCPMAARYFADKYTDQRRKKEEAAAMATAWNDVCGNAPELIAEMKNDWSKEHNLLKRSFYTGPKNLPVNHLGDALIYYQEKHADLDHKAAILVNHGFARVVGVDAQFNNFTKYQISEEFIALLRS